MKPFEDLEKLNLKQVRKILDLMIHVWAPTISKKRALYWIAAAITTESFKPHMIEKVRTIATVDELRIIDDYIKLKGDKIMPDAIIAQYAFMRAVQEYLITVENGSDVDTEK